MKRSEIDLESLLERDLFDDEDELLKNASIYQKIRKAQSNYQRSSSKSLDAVRSVGPSITTIQTSLNHENEEEIVRFTTTSEQKKQDDEALAPAFLFLASSLNVELVYCILKGITQFGYLTLTGPEPSVVRQKLAKMQL